MDNEQDEGVAVAAAQATLRIAARAWVEAEQRYASGKDLGYRRESATPVKAFAEQGAAETDLQDAARAYVKACAEEEAGPMAVLEMRLRGPDLTPEQRKEFEKEWMKLYRESWGDLVQEAD